MEVIILIGVIAVCVVVSAHFYLKSKHLREEAESLGDALRETIQDFEKDLQDHRDSERELSIVKAKLEAVKETSLTPDNAVPKDLHVEKVLNLTNELSAAKLMLGDVKEKLQNEKGKAISERVRLGQVGENFAAFHESFPYKRSDTKALFQPVDLICFEEDEVIFIDVKTGDSKLSKKQKRIKENIQAGRCRFEVHRLNENGYQIGDK